MQMSSKSKQVQCRIEEQIKYDLYSFCSALSNKRKEKVLESDAIVEGLSLLVKQEINCVKDRKVKQRLLAWADKQVA